MRNWIKRMAGLLALLFLAAAVTAGCARRPETTEDGRLKVVTTLFPYYDFVRQVAGDRVNLEADILGKYVEKLLGLAPQERRAGANRSGPGLSREFLEQYGY